MANLHLVTGFAGREHVTAADQGSLHTGIFGSGQFVLGIGNKLEAIIQDNNTVRVLDGDILIQGRHIRLNEGSFIDVAVDNGTIGFSRHDLIVARYTKDVATALEEVNLVLIKGENAESEPADPAYTEGDLITDHALQNDMPLYRVIMNGLVLQEIVPLFTAMEGSVLAKLNLLNEEKQNKITGAAGQVVGFDAEGNPIAMETPAPTAEGVVLSAATAALFGLTSSTVDNALSLLGNYNLHWWKRRINTSKYVENLGQPQIVDLTYTDNWNSVTYSDGINISENGTVSLADPTTTKTIYSSNVSTADDLVGKYFTTSISSSNIYKSSENSVSIDNNSRAALTNCQLVTSEFQEIVSEWEYVQSANRNAYPDSGISDEYEYRYIGIPFESLIDGGVKLATGSWVGTGSVNTRRTLTFNFTPRLLFIARADETHSRYYTMMIYGQARFSPLDNENTAVYGTCIWGENSIDFGSTAADWANYNENNKSYVYVAIGN